MMLKHPYVFFILLFIFGVAWAQSSDTQTMPVTVVETAATEQPIETTTSKNLAMAPSTAPADCKPVTKTTKYLVQKGDHMAAILRQFGLEPVFTSNGSLSQVLKLNNIPNQNLIDANDEILMPFTCEQQITKWTVEDKGEYRLITLEKLPEGLAMASPLYIPSVNISPTEQRQLVETQDENIEEILKPDADYKPPVDVEISSQQADEVSEALRYRMICEGEWTGTQCITRYSTLFATASGWFNRYDGVDPAVRENNQGVLLSRLNPAAEIGWHNYWTENFKSELSASMQTSQMLPEAREIPIEQDKKILSSIYAELRYEKGPYGFGAGLKNYDKQFYKFRFSGLSQPCFSADSAFAGCGIFVNSANIMSYFVNFSWMFHQAGKFSYDMKLYLASLGGANTGGYVIQNGTGWNIDLTLRHDRVREYLFGTMRYGQSMQNTSIEVQKLTELGFMFGYAWKLKDW
jgi:hypothetical protein